MKKKRKRYGQCLGVFFDTYNFCLFFEAKRPKKKDQNRTKNKISPSSFFSHRPTLVFVRDASSMKETLQISFDFCFSNTQTPEERSSSRPARDGCCGVKARTDVLLVHFGVRCARLTASKGRFLGANAHRREDANVALFWFVFWSRFFSTL